MFLIRFILVFLIVYLIIRAFIMYGKEEKPFKDKSEPDSQVKRGGKKISREIGEYIEYKEVDK